MRTVRAGLVAAALCWPAVAQAQSLSQPVRLSARGQDDLVGLVDDAIEVAFVLASMPGPGDAVYEVGEKRLHLTKLLLDVELPFGVPRPTADEAAPPADAPAPPRWLLQPILDLRGGYMQATRRASDFIPGYPDDGVRLELTGASLAGGLALRVALLDWLSIEPRLTVVYSHVRDVAARGSPADRARFSLAYDETLVGWRSENLSLVPCLALRAELPLGPVLMRALLSGAHLHTFSLSATTPLQEVRRDSQLYRLAVQAEVPLPGVAPWGRQVYALPGVTYNHLQGDVTQVLPRDYLEFSFGLAPDLRGALPMVSRLGLSLTYARGPDLEGWGWDVIWVADF